MRARDIKPGFYKNEQLAECSILARLIFPGLWMLADREGRLEYRPKKIKAELLPYDNADVPALIDELEHNGLVVLYEAEGKIYLWIPQFLRHQRPHNNEKASELPPHSQELCAKVESTFDQGAKCFQPWDEALRSSSLTPSSLNLEELRSPPTPPGGKVGGFEVFENLPENLPEEMPKAKKPEPQGPAFTKPKDAPAAFVPQQPPEPHEMPPQTDLGFEQFLDAYPASRRDRGAAWSSWLLLSRRNELPGLPRLLSAVTAWETCEQWQKDQGRFIPQASSWLAKRRWLDEPQTPVPKYETAEELNERAKRYQFD